MLLCLQCRRREPWEYCSGVCRVRSMEQNQNSTRMYIHFKKRKEINDFNNEIQGFIKKNKILQACLDL